MSESKKQRIAGKIDKYLQKCLSEEGHWVHFSKDDCGKERAEIYDGVRNMLKLMGIRYKTPPPFPIGTEDYGQTLKIQILKKDT